MEYTFTGEMEYDKNSTPKKQHGSTFPLATLDHHTGVASEGGKVPSKAKKGLVVPAFEKADVPKQAQPVSPSSNSLFPPDPAFMRSQDEELEKQKRQYEDPLASIINI